MTGALLLTIVFKMPPYCPGVGVGVGAGAAQAASTGKVASTANNKTAPNNIADLLCFTYLLPP